MSYTTKIEYEENSYRAGYRLTATHNDIVILDKTDGGEPEDNSFVRDYAWVAPALEDAYLRGVEDGKKELNKKEDKDAK